MYFSRNSHRVQFCVKCAYWFPACTNCHGFKMDGSLPAQSATQPTSKKHSNESKPTPTFAPQQQRHAQYGLGSVLPRGQPGVREKYVWSLDTYASVDPNKLMRPGTSWGTYHR